MLNPTLPWLADAALFASGSRALVELLVWGAARHGWTRVWLPGYYCPDVPAAVAAALPGLALASYPDHSLTDATALGSIPATEGDVVVVANQLGLRPRPTTALPRGTMLIEDHSHDPVSTWALESRADYAFASLRKTLPIPDGGAVWSPRGLPLPAEPTPTPRPGDAGMPPTRLDAALARWRERHPADETIPFRALARSAVGRLGATAPATAPGAISPVSRALLAHMPADRWRAARQHNLEVLAALEVPAGSRRMTSPPGGVAFAHTLVFARPADREEVRRRLAARAVAAAVIWPLDADRHPWAKPGDIELARRVLSIHCDQRYRADDMGALASALREA